MNAVFPTAASLAFDNRCLGRPQAQEVPYLCIFHVREYWRMALSDLCFRTLAILGTIASRENRLIAGNRHQHHIAKTLGS
jgi:hypothetical protein